MEAAHEGSQQTATNEAPDVTPVKLFQLVSSLSSQPSWGLKHHGAEISHPISWLQNSDPQNHEQMKCCSRPVLSGVVFHEAMDKQKKKRVFKIGKPMICSVTLADLRWFHQDFSHFNTKMDLYRNPGPITTDEAPKLPREKPRSSFFKGGRE